MKGNWFLGIVAALVVGALLLFGYAVFRPLPPYEAKGTTNLDALALDSSLTAGTYVQAGSYVGGDRQSPVTVASSGAITPTGTFLPITATGAVTTSTSTAIVSGTVSGQMLWLLNTVTHTITVKDAANTQLAGDFGMGQYDTLLLYWDGTVGDWIELARANN